MVFYAEEKSVPIPTKDIPSWIFDDPKYDQDEPIYIDAKDPSRSISLNQARVIVRKLVAGLQAAGLSKGDCVCLHSFNDINYPMLFLGIIAAGGVFAGTNPSYTEFELVHHINTAKAKFFITEPEMLKNSLAAAKKCGVPQSNIWIFDVLGQTIPSGFRSWTELLSHGEKDWKRFDDEKTCKETTATRLFSSGTTGLPKAAVLSHHNLISQHTLVHEMVKKPYEIKRLLTLPMFHAACVPVAHTTALRSGEASVVMRRFDLNEFLSSIEKFDITDVTVVPPIAIAIIMSPISKKYSLKGLKSVSCGAAPLGKEPQERLRQLLSPEASVTQVWGMTETSCIATKFYHPEDDTTGSVGRPIPCCDIKIIDGNGNDISAYDTRGEICVRGPIIIRGYFENPKANAESFDADGFFKTGDIVYCDSQTKKWYVVDRKKELIKVRGFQVAPPELEGVLLGHAQIVDAAVIG
ncbi:Acyl-CoA ligase, partial [Lachnellula willkommii]